MPARAKLFTHGGSQAVRLPKDFRMPGTEVLVRREGNAVILEPVATEDAWRDMWARIDAIGVGFPDPPDDPPAPIERIFDE
jgi:antitoxin VapB